MTGNTPEGINTRKKQSKSQFQCIRWEALKNTLHKETLGQWWWIYYRSADLTCDGWECFEDTCLTFHISYQMGKSLTYSMHFKDFWQILLSWSSQRLFIALGNGLQSVSVWKQAPERQITKCRVLLTYDFLCSSAKVSIIFSCCIAKCQRVLRGINMWRTPHLNFDTLQKSWYKRMTMSIMMDAHFSVEQ